MRPIIFDFGGVLIQWHAERAFARHFANDVEARGWMARIGFPGWNAMLDAGDDLASVARAARDEHGEDARPLASYADDFAASIADPVPGTWNVLHALSDAGHPLYGLTNWSAETFHHAEALYPELRTLFLDIVVSGRERVAKPDLAIFRLLCTRNGLDPADCLFIDDSAANVAAARDLGMDAIRFTDADALMHELASRGIAV
ncbi:HAD family phosphatase [Paracoccus sp. TK19116]|uniref:HAD family phosphatase n=1 Tax=Paracoccus albicereus TaxID=2922394 RepID=A0ABT1MSR7_9RHOB|nr:HAD family phosphatase [Paracoccus albicereus]MCQ0971354.1 HAD family phosphatase [Paracoccus albicereus]